MEAPASLQLDAPKTGSPAFVDVSDVRALYQQFAPSLRRALIRLAGRHADPDDLLHEVFMVALRRQDSLEAADEPRAWLYGVAVKVATAARRRAALRRLVGLADAPEPEGDESASRGVE